MDNMLVKTDIAGLCLGYELRYPVNGKSILSNYPPCDREPDAIVRSHDEILDVMGGYFPESTDSNVEYMLLPVEASDVLLPHNIVIIHAVAIEWRGKAWLFVAPSGTGKSTQYFRWKELLPDEVTIINGDKPALELRDDGVVYVHNTPWQGKEKLGNMISAPLGGVIFLSQEKENTIFRLSVHDALKPFFNAIMFRPGKESVHSLARIIEAALSSAPALHLGNLGDLASAELTRDFLIKEGYVC